MGNAAPSSSGGWMGCKDTTERDDIRVRSGRKLGARRFHPDRQATSKKHTRDRSSFSVSHSFFLYPRRTLLWHLSQQRKPITLMVIKKIKLCPLLHLDLDADSSGSLPLRIYSVTWSIKSLIDLQPKINTILRGVLALVFIYSAREIYISNRASSGRDLKYVGDR
jgi:hypothetical protein